MSRKKRFGLGLCLSVWLLALPSVHADIYTAIAAAGQKDYARAAELFQELAEIGEPDAQENLALLYVNGAGVPEDDVLGYAWAVLALESDGAHQVALDIVRQLDGSIDAAARARVEELRARFGQEALRGRLLPNLKPEAETARIEDCAVVRDASPVKHWPIEDGVYDFAVAVQVTVMPDGTARRPRVLYSFPPRAFDETTRATFIRHSYSPRRENGVAVKCTASFVYSVRPALVSIEPRMARLDDFAKVRTNAEKGDPNSQLTYGLILKTQPDLNQTRERSMPWFIKAAQAGVPAAQYLVGVHLMSGDEVERDEAKGRIWLEMAARAGSEAAQVALASWMLRSDQDHKLREQGFELMQLAAESGHREARYLYASLLASWHEESRRDAAKALEHISMVGAGFDYDPSTNEIRAAAQALLGDFKSAVKSQSRAIKRARQLGWDTAPLNGRLEAYQEGRIPAGELIEF